MRLKNVWHVETTLTTGVNRAVKETHTSTQGKHEPETSQRRHIGAPLCHGTCSRNVETYEYITCGWEKRQGTAEKARDNNKERTYEMSWAEETACGAVTHTICWSFV